MPDADKRKSIHNDVLVLSYWNLNSPSFGGARRIRALLDALGPRVTLCQPAPEHPEWPTLPYRPDLGKRKLGINWGMFNFMLPASTARVRRWLEQNPPKCIVATSIWSCLALRGLKQKPPVVLDAHDVLGNAIEERFGPRHPFTVAVRAWEQRVARDVTHVFACSDLDRLQFISRYGIADHKVSTVPNGVDMDFWQSEPHPGDRLSRLPPGYPSRLQDAIVLFFMGKLDYQPNREALKFLAGTLMPELERTAGTRFKLLVCGGPAPSVSPHPAMIFTGRVPDIRPYVYAADICLAPIFSGSGTRLKILEYMAAAKPVVATPKGAEGIAGLSDAHIRLAEANAFGDAIRTLAADPERARRLALAGRERVSERYDWKVIQAGWQAVFSTLGVP